MNSPRAAPSAAVSWMRRDAIGAAFVVGWLAVAAPYLGLLAGRPPSVEYRSQGAFVLLALLVVAACVIDLRRVVDAEERRFRLLVAAAFAAWAASEFADDLSGRFGAAIALAMSDIGFVLFAILMCAGALFEADRGAPPAEARLRSLHRAEVALFVFGVFVYLAVLPARLDPARAASRAPSAMLYATLDVLMLGLFAWRRGRARRNQDRERWAAFTLAALLLGLSDSLYLQTALGRIDIEGVAGLDLLWYLPHLAIVVGVRRRRTPAVELRREQASRGEPSHRMPELRVAPGFLYAALVPAIHLLAEVEGVVVARGAMSQSLFALLVTVGLLGLAAIHQRWNRELWQGLRLEIVASERRRVAAAKLEAIGRLAAGVAHDFNNLLTVIVGRAELIRGRVSTEEAAHEIDAMLEIADRASALTSELLAVGEREAGRREAIEIDAHLGARRIELLTRAGATVEVVFDLGAPGALCVVDRGHLERICDSLVANALGAMPRGGTLAIITRRRSLRSAWTRNLDEIPAGDYVAIEVRDTGEGMAPEALERAFEPFYNTKDRARGAGLGLATTRGLVRQNGGQIVARSTRGNGSSFELLFPEAS